MATTIYAITRDNLIKYDPFIKDNCWALTLFGNYSLDKCIKIDNLFGSAISDNTLYYLVSDDDYIMIDDEEYAPEELLENFYPSALAQYITKDVPANVYSQITDSDINFDDIDIEKMAINLLESGEDLQTIFDDAKDLDLIYY